IDPPAPPPSTGNPPTADAGQDQTVNEEDAVTLNGTGVDSDGNAVSDYLWQQVSGTTATLSGATTSSLSFTSPTITQIDVMVFTLTTTDSDGLIGIDTVSVIVLPVNASPTAEAGAVQTVSELSNVSLTGSGTDADSNDSITFQWSQISGGTTISLTGSDTATASFTAPDIPTTEAYVFALTVTDNEGAVAIDTVNIVITALNDLPVADAGGDQSVDEQTPISLTGTASDTDGTIASYEWSLVSDSPSVSLTNANTATVSLTTPIVLINSVDVLVLQLLVTDNAGGIHTDYVTVIVNPVLVDPVANAGVDQTLNELLSVTLNGSGTDEGSVINNYSWSQISPVSPVASLNDTTLFNPTFTGPDITNDTTFTFELTVTDSEGGTATDTVDINLTSLNTGPTLVNDPSETTPEDTPKVINTLLGNDSDPESDSFTLNSVTQPANGSVVIEANNLDVTYSPNLNFNGTDTFTYTAVDEFGAFSTNTATVTVNVTGVNDDPVAVTDEGAGYSVTQGFPILLSNLMDNDTDPEGDGLSITGVTQPGNGKAVNNGDGTVTYTPDLAFNGTDSFTYTIVDGVTGSDTGIINIVVIADTDGDGIIDTDEGPGGTGTDPLLADTDGDGFFDGHEMIRGTSAVLNTQIPPTTVISSGNSNNIINVDTTWTLFDSPYWVQSDVSVQSGATLTIEPGVVIKSNLNVDVIVNSGGILNAQGNAAIPQHVVFTSALDDQINGDTNGDGVASVESDNDWGGIDYNAGSNGTIRYGTVKNAGNCIGIYNSSPVIDNVEIGDCQYYGIDFQTSSSTRTANLSYLTFNDYDNNGQSTGYAGVRIYNTGPTTTVLNINNLTMFEPGNSSNYGFYIYANGGSINGSIDSISITNPGNDGIHILNSSSGNVDLTLSNMSVSGSPNNSLEIRDSYTTSGTLTTTITGNNSITNAGTNAAVRIENNDPDFHLDTLNPTDPNFSNLLNIDSAGYGMNLINSAGNYNNISINNLSIAGIRLASSTNPVEFSNVVLTNAITPYELVGQNLTATIIAGYDFDDVSVAKSYIRVLGSLLGDMTLTSDPLGTGNSVWHVTSTITVPAAYTLTVNDGAVLKFGLNTYLYVDGTLITGDPTGGGDGAGVGTKAMFTSIRDNS
ncbi:MAG: tandem-95 repeat protein, partial [Gammaproteobacteria bacterium]|nr:tandem-95 repeat protein [Gammaproteobacteria bacterium]